MNAQLDTIRNCFKHRMPHFDLSDTYEFLDSIQYTDFFLADEVKPPFDEFVASVNDKEFAVFIMKKGNIEVWAFSYENGTWVNYQPSSGSIQGDGTRYETGEIVQKIYPQLVKATDIVTVRAFFPFVDKIDYPGEHKNNPTCDTWIIRLLKLAYHLNTSEAKILDAHPTDWWKPKKKSRSSKYHTRYLQLDRRRYINCSEGIKRNSPSPHDVRGHYRKLSTGKKVWIRAHRKGKGFMQGEDYKVKRKIK
jgi:hypothetical protein